MKVFAAVVLVLCYLAASEAWTCGEAPPLYNVAQIDAGQGKVVARTTSNYAYFLIGSSWHKLSDIQFRHITVGPAGLWGCSTTSSVYKYVAGIFQSSTGESMMQVDAGGNDHLVGASTSSGAYCLISTYASAFKGGNSLSWTYQSRVLKYYSCSPGGCWGVDTSDRIYFTQSLNPTTCSTSSWTEIPGLAKMVEVGTDGSVFVVNKGGQVYQRTGILSSRPQGSDWSFVSMCMPIHHVSYDLGTLWAVTNGGILLKCSH